MNSRSIVSPEDQKVTFIELFFDLIFVFAVTQVTSLLHDGFTWGAVGQAVLVFWLVWWAWTQFAWTLNSADTTHHLVEFGTLVATAVTFFMAVALPDAFEGRGLQFAIPYILVRAIGLGLYIQVASVDPSQHAAVRNFAWLSLGGLAAVLVGGFLGGTAQYAFWGLAIVLDIVASARTPQAEGWSVYPEHFGERHGLFVIIALGEALIVAAGGMMGVVWTGVLTLTAVVSVAISCGLWWSYFERTKPALNHAFESASHTLRAALARDAFSLIHFPMVFGIIAYAAAVEEAMLHPGEPYALEWRIALALGVALFVGGMAVALWRATGRLLLPRVLLTLVTAVAILALADVSSIVSLAIAFVGILAVVLSEQRALSLAVGHGEGRAEPVR